MGFDWSKYSAEDDKFVRWSEGLLVEGTVTAIGEKDFGDGKVHPEVTLDTPDGERVITASAYRLRKLFADNDPQVGDVLTVQSVRKVPLSGGREMWEFTMDVASPGDRHRGHGAPKPPPPQSAFDDEAPF